MKRAASEIAGIPAVEGPRSLEASVGFGLSHRLRIEILAELHDRPATRPELAHRLAVPRERLRYHIDELVKDGSIEVAERTQVGNVVAHVYRVTRLAFNSESEWQQLPPADRQQECAVILQATWAEALASLWAGKFHTDPDVVNIWNRIILDSEGRADLSSEQASSWNRIEEIEGEAASSRARSTDSGQRYVVASFGYERGRSAAPDPRPFEAGIVEDACRSDGQASLAHSGRTIEEAVTNSIAHRLRIEILAALHEHPSTAIELARILGQPVGLLSHHVRQLVNDGSIEIARRRYIRNLAQPVYTVIKLPCYDSEDWRRLSPEERQVTSAVALRAAMAESLTSLWAGKLHSDDSLMLAWKPVVLTPSARVALTNEQKRSWERVCEIEREATTRLKANDQSGKLHIVTLLSFERSRNSLVHSRRSDGIP